MTHRTALAGGAAWALLAASSLAAPPRVLASLRLPFTSSAAPAVADTDGDGRPEIAVTVDHIGDRTRDEGDPANVNAVYLLGWRGGALQYLPGWPRKTRDAALGLAAADLNRDGNADILAACGQDRAPDLMERAGLWLTSRLLAWNAEGKPLNPWSPEGASLAGSLVGHAYAAPVVHDLDGDGRPEILHAGQGIWQEGAFRRGGLRIWRADGTVYGQTQADDRSLPWHVRPGFSMDAPPVIADLDGDGKPEVVAGAYNGEIHAWRSDGSPLRGWHPSPGAKTSTTGGALLRNPVTAADLNGDGRDEVLAAAYDGALYAWDGAGKPVFRAPAIGRTAAALTTGASVGRFSNGDSDTFAVAGGSDGWVTAWRGNGRVAWRARTTPGYPVIAEPAIGDVDADGDRDVVVGGTDGYLYAFDGGTGKRLWRVMTAWAPTAEGMRLEGISGAPALTDVNGDGRLDIVAATGQRTVADARTRTWQGFGHVIVYDCGPGTYRPDTLDWPQYRRNARRSGRR